MKQKKNRRNIVPIRRASNGQPIAQAESYLLYDAMSKEYIHLYTSFSHATYTKKASEAHIFKGGHLISTGTDWTRGLSAVTVAVALERERKENEKGTNKIADMLAEAAANSPLNNPEPEKPKRTRKKAEPAVRDVSKVVSICAEAELAEHAAAEKPKRTRKKAEPELVTA